ncbi:hypothetical protein DERP_001797, partial [Dermatophagoides pteronyssinus]
HIRQHNQSNEKIRSYHAQNIHTLTLF